MKIYDTTHNGTRIRYQYKDNRVSIIRNDEYWGSPQGERFVVALLEDIEKLQKENNKLKEALEIVESEYWKR
jgi:hypothetical protein